MKIQVSHNQSLLDVAIQAHGNLDGLVVLAFENGLTITDDLAIGTNLDVTKIPSQAQDIVEFFQTRKSVLATNLSENDDWVFENNDPCNLCKCFT